MPGLTNGKVYLVGAGPGDPELLTLKAVRVLGLADVVLVDDLVDDAALAYGRPGVRVVRVGKRGGCASTSQQFIERLMVAEARSGRTVVRLKGGDPVLFGRGGEECAALRRAGIEYEVVNGITAALGAATAAGVALTHRDAGHGVTFVAGHVRDGSRIDWHALASTGTTLVVYMGVARVAEIAMGLVDGGLSPTTPAVIVQDATGPREKVVSTTLAELPADLRAAGIRSPAILIIGEVAAVAGRCRNSKAFESAAHLPRQGARS